MRADAVLLDALGTLVRLEPPAPRLRALLAEAGFEVSEERAAAGFSAEIAYYLDHHLEGSDQRLDDLRDRCAAAMMEGLGLAGLDRGTARRVMLEALEFTAYPDAVDGVRRLRHDGMSLVVVSNWDCSLPDWLGRTGLLELLDGVVTSAEVGAAKPDAAVFRRALELARVKPGRAVHVGDSLENDVAGARGAGIRPILVERDGDPPAGVQAVRSLVEVALLV